MNKNAEYPNIIYEDENPKLHPKEEFNNIVEKMQDITLDPSV